MGIENHQKTRVMLKKIFKWVLILGIGLFVIDRFGNLALRLMFRGMVKEAQPGRFEQYLDSMADEDGWVMVKHGPWEKGEDDQGVYYARSTIKDHLASNMRLSSGESINLFKSYNRGDEYDHHPVVFIGPWYEEPELKIQIRKIKRQDLRAGRILTGFESKDERNSKIPEMLLNLVRENNCIAGGRFIYPEENLKVQKDLQAQGYYIWPDEETEYGQVRSYNKTSEFWNTKPVVFIGEWRMGKNGKRVRTFKRQDLYSGRVYEKEEEEDAINAKIPPQAEKLIRPDHYCKYLPLAEHKKIIADLRATGYVVERDYGNNLGTTDLFKSYNRGDEWDDFPVVEIDEWTYNTEQKHISRQVSRQALDNGQIFLAFETRDALNKNIKPMKLRLREDNSLVSGIRPITKQRNEEIIAYLEKKGYKKVVRSPKRLLWVLPTRKKLNPRHSLD